MAVQTPRVVILNGASSSGKTTLATAFRDQRAVAGDFWFMFGIDDFLAKVPAEWMSAGPHRGAFAADGVRFDATAIGTTVSVGSRVDSCSARTRRVFVRRRS
jgi:chloramphenicol 3-O-phosphotransferase